MAQKNDWWTQGATAADTAKPSDDWWRKGATSVDPEPSLARSIGDSAIALGSGVTQGVKMLTDVAGADNAVSSVLGKATDALTDLESPYRKAEKQTRAQKIKQADDSGSTWEQVKAYTGAFAEAPLDTTLNALGTSVPTLAAGLVTGGGAAAGIAARAAQVGIGAAQGVGGIKGQIHESVKQKHLEAGATEADATKRADEAQAYSGPNAGSIALGGTLGAVAGGTGAESAVRRLAGQRVATEAAETVAPGLVRSTLSGVAHETPMEMLQGGQERYASNTALQGEGFDVPTWQGVAGQAALEGLASAPMGGGFGAIEGMAHRGVAQRQGEGAAAFAAGESRTPPESIKSVVAKGQWVRGWDAAQAQGSAEPVTEPAAADAIPGAAEAPSPEAPSTDSAPGIGSLPEAPAETAPSNWETGTSPLAQQIQGSVQSAQEVAAQAMKPSERMGLDPNAGALSAAAVMAVDSGATDQLQAAALQEAAQAGPSGVAQPTPDPTDPETGEVAPAARMQELQQRLQFIEQQARTNGGWDMPLVEARDAARAELTALTPSTSQAQSNENPKARQSGALAPGEPVSSPSPATPVTAGPVVAGTADDVGLSTGDRIDQLEASAADAEARAADWSGRDYKPNSKPLPKYEAAGGPADVQEANEQRRLKEIVSAKTAASNARVQAETLRQQGNAQAQQAAKSGGAGQVPGLTAGEQRARGIAQDGAARRAQQLDASERWTRMPTAERQALAQRAPDLNAVAKKNVHTRAWGDLGPKVRGQLADAMAPKAQDAPVVKAPAIEGKDIDGDWMEFSKESGTKSVARAEMPQIKAAHRGAMTNFMNARGIAHQEESVPAASLKPTQAEFSRKKVAKAKAYADGDRAILVSQDGHVLDGHHQWLAAREQGNDVRVIRLAAPIDQLLEAARDFPSSTTSAGAAPPVEAKDAQVQGAAKVPAPEKKAAAKAPRGVLATMAQAAEAARADYFAPGSIVRSYGGHDRVLSYQPGTATDPWSVTVQAVVQQDGQWVADPKDNRTRSHTTQPDARALKAGPVERVAQEVQVNETAEQTTIKLDPVSPDLVREDGQDYRAETRRKGYSDEQTDLFEKTEAGQQIRLFLDDGPVESQAGPRGAAAQSTAAAAVADIYATKTILGLALSRDYAARQRVSLVGQEVKSAADLAVLAQVYRDPRFETFRLVFVNDAGNVVSQMGLTSRLPGSATAVIGSDVGGYLRDVSEAARNTGATGFYMLHNHPSGISAASNADRGLTASFASQMPMLEFKSHVVIDTNEYTTIDRSGRVQTHHKDFGQPAPMTYGEWGGRQVSGPADIMAMAKQMAVDESAVTLITLDNQLRVKGVTELAANAIGFDKAANHRAVLKATMRQQGARVVAVGRDLDKLLRLEGVVLDAVMVLDEGAPRSLVERGMLQGSDLFPQDRRARLSADSSGSFDYLRAQTAPQEQSSQRVAEPDTSREAEAAASRGMTPDLAQQLLRIMGQAPEYSPAARAQAVATVRKTVDAIRSAWANGPEVVVAFDMNDPAVPAAARAEDLKQRSGGAAGTPEGFYWKGRVYLLSSQLNTPNDAARVLFHEALGHHGLRGAFGKDLDSILNQVATMRRADVDAKIKEYGLRGVSDLDRRTAAEEVLAEMAQTTPQLHFVKRAISAIRNWLRANVPGFRSLAMTDSDIIQAFILPARSYVEQGARPQGAVPALAFSRGVQAPLRQAVTFAEARVAAKAFQGKPIANGQTGLEAVVSRNSLDKMLSSKAVGKSASAAAHSTAVANVDTLFQNAVWGWSKTDRAENTNIAAIHRFFVPMAFEGRELMAKMTVKETVDVNHSNPIYTVEAVDFNEKSPAAQWVDASAKADGIDLTSIRSAGDVLSLAEGIEQRNQGVGDAAMFSRGKLSQFKTKAIDQIHATLSHPGTVSVWDKTVGTMYNLAERAPAFKPVFQAAQRFVDDVSTLATDAADAAPRILPKLEHWADLKKQPIAAADNRAIARPIFEGTLMWGRDEKGQPALVDDLAKAATSLTPDDKAQLLLRTGKLDAGVLKMWRGLPVAQYENLINSRFESKHLKAGIVWTQKELETHFKLTPQQGDLYREFRAGVDRSIDVAARADMLRVLGKEYAGLRDAALDAGTLQDALDLLTGTLLADAKASPDKSERLMQLHNQVVDRATQARELQDAGYAPLSRFGRFTVDVVDPAGERLYFGMFETKHESNKMTEAMRREFKGATVEQGTMSEQAFKLFQGITPESLELFGNMLGLKSEGNGAQDKAFQEYLKLTKNNHSAMKRLMHRKGITGYSEDVGRVLASFIYSNARQSAAGLNMGDLDTAINEVPKDQGELKDVAIGLRDYIKNPQEEAQAVRGLLFAQYLGGSVASAIVNMSQPFAVTFPWLSQFGGARKAAQQLGRAFKDMGTKGLQYEPDLARALKNAEDSGVVSPQEVHQLMAQARGSGSLRSGDGTKAGDARAAMGNKLAQFSLVWGKGFSMAEQINRRSTFIAAFRTAQDQGMSDPAAFAAKAVLETQFLYSKANKMRWARGAVGGTLMTFKTYSIAYLELMHRMWTQGGPEGKKAVGMALVMLMLMGGAGGLPFAEDLEDVIDSLGQAMGYNISAKQWRKQAMRSVLGESLGEFLESGVSGLPGSPVDVSGRLGMGNLLPGTGLMLTKRDNTRDLLELVGPAGDFIKRGFTGAGMALKGLATGGQRALDGELGAAGGAVLGGVALGALEVSPGAVRNVAKGIDMAARGMYRDSKGYKVLDTTIAEALAKGAGFQPKSVAEVQEANSFMLRSKSFYTQNSSDIKAQWAKALFEKDESGLAQVRERLAAWNRNNPEQPIVVKMPDVWKKVREMGKDRTQRIADTAPKALRAQMREEVAGLRGGVV